LRVGGYVPTTQGIIDASALLQGLLFLQAERQTWQTHMDSGTVDFASRLAAVRLKLFDAALYVCERTCKGW